MRRTYRVATEPGDAYFIPGDLHFGDCEEGALEEAWDYFLYDQPTLSGRFGVILQGDTLDAHQLSKHPKDARRSLLAGEIELAAPWLHSFSSSPLGCTMILGNHEHRVARSIRDDVPGLLGLPGTDFGALTGLKDIPGLEILGHGDRVVLGRNVVVEHGDAMRGGKNGRKSTSAVLRDYPEQVTIYGHTHAAACEYKTIWGPDGPSVRAAVNVGHFQRMDGLAEFAPDPNWQHAFAVVRFLEDGMFSVKLYLVLKSGKKWVVV